MSPVASLAGAYRTSVPVLANPPDNSSVVINPVLEWDTDAGMGKVNSYVHFLVQFATDSAFVNVVKEYFSWVGPVQRFQYENTPGVWVGFAGPAASDGMVPSNLGKRVRCNTDFVTIGTFYWRVRSEQFI